MIRCGELCKSCGVKCRETLEDFPAEIACIHCEDTGCDECGGTGVFTVEGCPKNYCKSIAMECNLVSAANKGHLPVAGGMLDQSPWFVEFWNRLDAEQNNIDAERIERNSRKR